ncbi:MAG: T9SS type A sorting domain-containing protein [Saprospiraceae bacterium]
MRIQYLLVIVIFILFKHEYVQSQTYHFSVSTKPYVDLIGGTPLVSDIWDDPELTIPIGFDFQYYGETIQTLYLPATFSLITLIDDPTAANIANIILFGADMIDRGYITGTSLSPISYKTDGNAGHRVLTLEWKNAGFVGDLSEFGVSTDFINFQLKLYEEDGNIEFIYGPSLITHPSFDYGASGPIIGLIESLDFINDVNLGEIILLAGNPSNPTQVNAYVETHLNGTMAPGTSYTFSRNTTGVTDIRLKESKSFYYPNPSNSFVTLKPELQGTIISPVLVLNNIGQLVRSDSKPDVIELDNLPTGVYQLLFQTSAGQVVQRIFVQD